MFPKIQYDCFHKNKNELTNCIVEGLLMSDQTIKCSKCGYEIPLTEALTGQIEQSIELKYEMAAAENAKELDTQKQALKQQAKELEIKGKAIQEQVAEQVKTQRKKIAEEEKAKVLAEQREHTKTLEEELQEQTKKLQEAQRQEFELRKQQRQVEQESKEIKLTVQRQIDEERKKIEEQASKDAAEKEQLKLREKDDQLASMKKQIDELKRRAEVGSQEAQGEALEGALQDVLQQTFPIDAFEEVKKGARGADIIQRVHNRSGKECGTILWESKNTKDFQKPWIEKLKKDQQYVNASVAVIMSVTLPKQIDSFGVYEGVWVSDYKSVIGLATALRYGLVEVARQKIVTAGRDSVKDVIYEYVTGNEFAMHIKAVVNAFGRMQEQLGKERRAMEKIWKAREKQIITVLDNVVGIRGSIEGLVGEQKSLPEVDMLSLDAIIED